MRTELRPLSVSEIVDTAIDLYKQSLSTFVAIAAVVYVPYAVLLTIFSAFVRSLVPPEPETPDLDGLLSALPPLSSSLSASLGLLGRLDEPASNPALTLADSIGGGFAAFVGTMLFLGIVYPLCTGALVVSISAGYLGEEIGAAESYRRVWSRLGRLLSAQALVMLAVMGGILLCIVPGMIFSLWFLLVPVVVLLEEQSPIESLGRSRSLISGELGKGILFAVIAWLLDIVVGFVVRGVLGLIPLIPEMFSDFVGTLMSGLTLPLSIAILVLFYYDLRVRKEAFSLRDLETKSVQQSSGETSQTLDY